MTINIVRPVRYTEDPDLLGGPNGMTVDVLLVSGGGTDKVLLSGNENDILVSGGGTDKVLISPFNCQDELLVAGTTDSVLVSGGGSDVILVDGYCSSSLLESGEFIEVTT